MCRPSNGDIFVIYMFTAVHGDR